MKHAGDQLHRRLDELHTRFDEVVGQNHIAQTLKKGDVVLIKGSRGVKLEQAINTVRAAFSSMEP